MVECGRVVCGVDLLGVMDEFGREGFVGIVFGWLLIVWWYGFGVVCCLLL